MVAIAERASGDGGDLMYRSTSLADDRDHSDFQRGVKKLVENLLFKLNPWAEEFFPSSQSPSPASSYDGASNGALSPVDSVTPPENGCLLSADGFTATFRYRKRRNGDGKVKRTSEKVRNGQSQDLIRRTVYISEIDRHVTEEQLATLFSRCGDVLDCRICGDPHSNLRFAFIEFDDEEGARAALSLSGSILGYYPLRVLPSKTAILPINPTYLPKSYSEMEMCARTVYCTNIDKKVTRAELKALFENICGEAESAIVALNCSGLLVRSLPIRVSPSKTPVRARAPRAAATKSRDKA